MPSPAGGTDEKAAAADGAAGLLQLVTVSLTIL